MTPTSFTRRLLAAFGMSLAALTAAPTWAQSPADAPLPGVQHGRVERWANVPSQHVDPRHVDVWLPEGYSPAKRYAVLYMHDGQMLFDARTTWNKQAWNVQDALARLRAAGRIRDVIVVGVWNNGKWRHSEYLPQAFLLGLPAGFREALVREGLQGKPQSDAYLRFLVEELKPAIDARYATRPDRDNTFIMGSSMGGLISVYAMNRYPEVFGGAAGLSTHWVGRPTAWGRERVRNAALPLAAGAASFKATLLVPADDARFGMPEVRVGIPSVVEAALLPMLIGWGRARRLLLLGEIIGAAEALEWGLVERVAPAAGLDAAVEEWLGHLGAGGPLALRSQKKLMREWENLPADRAVAAGVEAFAASWRSDEPAGMMRRFLDRPRGRIAAKS